MDLPKRMAEFKEEFEADAPQEAVAVMHGATEELRNSGILDQVVKEGEKAPDFMLGKADGDTVTLSGLLERGPVVLGFFRGKW